MTADIDDTTGNRTMSDTSSTTSQTNNNNNSHINTTTSSISVSNAVSKIDALLNGNNGGIGANFPRNNGRKLKPLITMPSIEISTSITNTTVSHAVTSSHGLNGTNFHSTNDTSDASVSSTSVTATVPTTTNTVKAITPIATNETKIIDETDRNHVDDVAQSISIRQENNNFAGSRARPDNQYLANPSKPSPNAKNQMQHIHHHHHHHHQHKQLSPTQKGKNKKKR